MPSDPYGKFVEKSLFGALWQSAQKQHVRPSNDDRIGDHLLELGILLGVLPLDEETVPTNRFLELLLGEALPEEHEALRVAVAEEIPTRDDEDEFHSES